MEEFLLEHGGLIVSGIIALITLVLIAMFIWTIAKMNIVSTEMTLGVCL